MFIRMLQQTLYKMSKSTFFWCYNLCQFWRAADQQKNILFCFRRIASSSCNFLLKMRGCFAERESGRKCPYLHHLLFLSFECFLLLPLAFLTFTAYLYTCSLVRERCSYPVGPLAIFLLDLPDYFNML